MANGPSSTDLSNPNTAPHHRIEIKDADVVQEQLVGGFNWLEDNSKVVVALIAVAVILGIAYASWSAYVNHNEKVAANEFYKIEAPFLKKKEAFDKAKYQAFMPADPAEKTPAEKASGDLAKDYGPYITGMESIAHDYAGTTAGAQAAILGAETLIAYKDFDKAAELASIPATRLGKDHTLGLLGRIMWGNALSAKGDCQGALDKWQQVLDTPSAGYLAADVNLRAGACLEKLGQNDRAAEMYRKASTAGATGMGSESPSATSAKGLLRALELKNPNLAVSPTATETSGLKLQPTQKKAE